MINRNQSLATIGAGLCLAAGAAQAMDVRVLEDQLILSGQVVDGDLGRFEKALAANPKITTIILRNSPGGHPQTGFRVGEIIRQKGLTTAVSGYCYSSCSRMYLGGVRRIFTDDYPPGATNIGFHGHYKKDGTLDTELMKKTGLRNWIIKFLDGKADVVLVDRWVNIPKNNGMAHFFNPALVKRNGASTFFCGGGEPGADQPFKCEAITKSALDLGVSTATDLIQSRDQAEIRRLVPAMPPPRDPASRNSLIELPVKDAAAIADLARYAGVGAHKAFAVSASKTHWAWSAGPPDAMASALRECEERDKGPCRLFAVDEDVVWREP